MLIDCLIFFFLWLWCLFINCQPHCSNNHICTLFCNSLYTLTPVCGFIESIICYAGLSPFSVPGCADHWQSHIYPVNPWVVRSIPMLVGFIKVVNNLHNHQHLHFWICPMPGCNCGTVYSAIKAVSLINSERSDTGNYFDYVWLKEFSCDSQT